MVFNNTGQDEQKQNPHQLSSPQAASSFALALA
jgi:hypothetical protein